MSADDPNDRAKFTALLERMVRLGGLLNEDLDPDDPRAVAEVKVLIAEMDQTPCFAGQGTRAHCNVRTGSRS